MEDISFLNVLIQLQIHQNTWILSHNKNPRSFECGFAFGLGVSCVRRHSVPASQEPALEETEAATPFLHTVARKNHVRSDRN